MKVCQSCGGPLWLANHIQEQNQYVYYCPNCDNFKYDFSKDDDYVIYNSAHMNQLRKGSLKNE